MSSDPVLESAFYSARSGMAIVAPNGRFLRVNPALSQIVGYPEGELTKLTFQEITHPDDLEPDLIQAERVIRGEIDGYDMEKRYFRKDGSVVWIELSVAAVRDRSGSPLYLPVNIFDLTKFREEQARNTRQMLEKALQSLEDKLVTTDAGIAMLKIVKGVGAEPTRLHNGSSANVESKTFQDGPSAKWRRALTPCEQKILALVAKGKTSKEIAQALGISHRTVEVHRATATRKIKSGLSNDLLRQLIASCVWQAAA